MTGRLRHGLCQRGGGLHPGGLRPAEEQRPHPRPFPVRPWRLQASGDQRQPHGHDSERVLQRMALQDPEEPQ